VIKVVARPLDGADLQGGFLRLRTLVYPQYNPEARDLARGFSLWRWLESHPLGDKMQRWFLVTEEGVVVGHLAATAQYYRINQQRIIAHTPTDYMVHPKYGFHALTLMRRFFRSTENCVAPDVEPAVIKVETRLGAEEAGKLQFAVKIWDMSSVPNILPSMPMPIAKLLNWGLRVVDGAVGNTLLEEKLEVEEMPEGFDESFDELFEKIATVVPCLPEKDAAFLRWRYGPDSPQAPVTILGVRGEEGILGYAVLKVTWDGQDGYILDLTTLPGRYDVARALLQEAVRHFRQARVKTIRYRFLESLASPRSTSLWRLGFVLLRKRRYSLLVKFGNRNLHKTANDTARWSYSLGDGEASFWIR